MTGVERMPEFRRLGAMGQLKLLHEHPLLMPQLLRLGLSAGEAQALAYNAALLYRVLEAKPPLHRAEEVLQRYSLGEIAELCETWRKVAAGELEYGEAEN